MPVRERCHRRVRFTGAWYNSGIVSASDSILGVRCTICGLTLEQLKADGRLGCPTCYRTFARLVTQAVELLHGVTVPPESNPWPTRRADRRDPS